MSQLMQAMTHNDDLTANGMVSHSTTDSACLDLFGTIGSARNMEDHDLIHMFVQAFNEDSLKATKILFWARDVRGGAGERKAFRTIINYMGSLQADPEMRDVVEKNAALISEYGRWDDLLSLFGTSSELTSLRLIKNALAAGNGLCAKWMPRKGDAAKKLRAYLNLAPKVYRKGLVNLTNVVETPMCNNDYSNVDYSKLPSLASSRYQQAFQRNDPDGYAKFILDVANGDVKVNASALFPYDVLKSLGKGNVVISNAQWVNLPNYMEGSDERIIPVVDVSASMSCAASGQTTCMDVAISLGIYISERNEGIFKDQFITFTNRPRFVKLTGTIDQKVRQVKSGNVGYDTNIELMFRTILDSAIKNHLPQSEMPTKLLILSDMEFNNTCITGQNCTEMVDALYKSRGYTRPEIVYWNLNARVGNKPVKVKDDGTALVSGFSPSIMKSLLADEEIDTSVDVPKEVIDSMLVLNRAIEDERYDAVTV